jgi:cytidylate kinase
MVYEPAGPAKIRNRLIEQAVRRFQAQGEERRKAATGGSRVITISRQLGAGGRRVAEILGEKLGLPVYDKEILEALAKRSAARYRSQMFEELDESAKGEIEILVSSLLGKVDHHTYYYLLPKTMLAFARRDCIILGRAAHLFLPNSLRLRMEAPFEIRVQNMIKFEGLEREAAEKQIKKSDRSREKFTQQMMGMLETSRHWERLFPLYDLTINTRHFSAAEAADIVLCAAAQCFPGPKPGGVR